MSAYSDTIRQMKDDMAVAFDFFKLSPQARKMATAVAMERPDSASACYRAIVNSIPNLPPKGEGA